MIKASISILKGKWYAVKDAIWLKFNALTGNGISFEETKTERMLNELDTKLQKTIEELRKTIATL
jgi:hypothetical protein